MKTSRFGFSATALILVGSSMAGFSVDKTRRAISYDKDVAPIIYTKCASCHHPGQVAPFALLSYTDVKKRSAIIDDVVRSKVMPPWKAYGDCAFRDNRGLSDREIAVIHSWIQGGMPEGKTRDLPPAPQFTSQWLLGTPDLVVKMAKPFHVPADGPDIYRNFVLPLNLPGDTYIRAIDFQPGTRSVVHHSLFFYDSTGSARAKDGLDGQPGFSGAMGAVLGGGGNRGSALSLFSGGGRARGALSPIGSLGGWAVGAQAVDLPDGLAYGVPKGADLILSTHFHPTGKAEDEQSTVGLYFAKRAPKKQFTGVQLPPLFGFFSGIDIPAGEKKYTIEDSFTLPVDTKAFGVAAHAHYLAREMTLTATLPDGKSMVLLSIPDWDFNWQDQYVYQRDVDLPKGTVLHSKLVYDNSTDNPRNPSNPPKRVKWGEQTTDEMGSLILRLVAANEDEMPALQTAYRIHIRDFVMKRPRRGTGGE